MATPCSWSGPTNRFGASDVDAKAFLKAGAVYFRWVCMFNAAERFELYKRLSVITNRPNIYAGSTGEVQLTPHAATKISS